MIFRFYALLTAGMIAVAGVAITALRGMPGIDLTHARKAYRGWLIMVPLLLAVLLLGRVAVIVFFTSIALSAFKEFSRATGLYNDWIVSGTVNLSIILVGISALVPDPARGLPGWYGSFMALPVFAISGILMIPILRNRAKGQLQIVALAIVGFIYFGWMLGHVAFLANARQAGAYLLYLLLAVALNDVSAYVFGKLFGRHPLRSNISPCKTWEGAVGALSVSLALPWLLRFTFPHFDGWDCLLVGLIVGLGGQIGDLTVSTFKRDLGIKDLASAIPGHGGILDRVDSLVFVAPLFFHYAHWRHGIY